MNVRQSDLKYLKRTYGVRAKIREVSAKVYIKLCAFIKWLSLTVTLLLIPVYIGCILYYSLIDFNPMKSLVYSALLWVTIDSNSKL